MGSSPSAPNFFFECLIWEIAYGAKVGLKLRLIIFLVPDDFVPNECVLGVCESELSFGVLG